MRFLNHSMGHRPAVAESMGNFPIRLSLAIAGILRTVLVDIFPSAFTTNGVRNPCIPEGLWQILRILLAVFHEGAFTHIRKISCDTLPFIPFLWHYQNERNADLLLAEMKHRSNGTYYFATIFVPGSVYFIPLHRFDEAIAFERLAEMYSLNRVRHPVLLKRDPMKIEAHLSTESNPRPTTDQTTG